MNIFATYDCPIKSAKYLDNKRQIKMILESAQLMCTALDHYGVSTPYKPTHKQHPCAVWVRQNRSNYIWLLKHFAALIAQYNKKYGKRHKCVDHAQFFINNVNSIPDGARTPFPNCAANSDFNISYKHIIDVHLAYRLYLRARWKHDSIRPKWR